VKLPVYLRTQHTDSVKELAIENPEIIEKGDTYFIFGEIALEELIRRKKWLEGNRIFLAVLSSENRKLLEEILLEDAVTV
jgi:hypothetical protein